MSARLDASASRIVLVDGFAGTGKSTAAQRLCLQMRRTGQAATWVHEHDPAHPVFRYGELDELLQVRAAACARSLVEKWSALAADRRTGRVLILEGSFFQITVGVLLSSGMPADDILGVLAQIEERIAALRPRLVHLRHADLRAGLLGIAEHRGAYWLHGMIEVLRRSAWGRRHRVRHLDGLLAFYEAQQHIIDQACTRLRMPRLVVDVSGGAWDRYHSRISRFAGAGTIATVTAAPNRLSRCSGTYRGRRSRHRSVISTDGQRLYLHSPGRAADPLLPVDPGVFWLQSMPVELSFALDRPGPARGFAVRARLEDRRVPDTSFTRVS